MVHKKTFGRKQLTLATMTMAIQLKLYHPIISNFFGFFYVLLLQLYLVSCCLTSKQGYNASFITFTIKHYTYCTFKIGVTILLKYFLNINE